MATAVAIKRSRFLTVEEKVDHIAEFECYKADPSNWRRQHPSAKGGEGYIDHEVLPLCDALNAIDGVCTIQSCCGHQNKHGYIYPGHLWIRLSEELMRRFEEEIAWLLDQDVIQHVSKLYCFQHGNSPHEVIDIKFLGEYHGRMDEAQAVIACFFEGLAE